jgi:hypothetical protein
MDAESEHEPGHAMENEIDPDQEPKEIETRAWQCPQQHGAKR